MLRGRPPIKASKSLSLFGTMFGHRTVNSYSDISLLSYGMYMRYVSRAWAGCHLCMRAALVHASAYVMLVISGLADNFVVWFERVVIKGVVVDCVLPGSEYYAFARNGMSVLGKTHALRWAYAFHQDKASSVKVPVANVTLFSSGHFTTRDTDCFLFSTARSSVGTGVSVGILLALAISQLELLRAEVTTIE
ncbi:hypothetical protein Tco_0851304 [Tanacetum coccineum]